MVQGCKTVDQEENFDLKIVRKQELPYQTHYKSQYKLQTNGFVQSHQSEVRLDRCWC